MGGRVERACRLRAHCERAHPVPGTVEIAPEHEIGTSAAVPGTDMEIVEVGRSNLTRRYCGAAVSAAFNIAEHIRKNHIVGSGGHRWPLHNYRTADLAPMIPRLARTSEIYPHCDSPATASLD